MRSHNITTHFHPNQRVSFAAPEGGFRLEDLDTLEAAIQHARRRLVQQQPELATSLEPEQAFAEQLTRLAAPT